MDHEIFFEIFDVPQNIFLCSIFLISLFNLTGVEHKISKTRQGMLNKLYSLSRYKRNNGKNKNKMFDAFLKNYKFMMIEWGGQILHFLR